MLDCHIIVSSDTPPDWLLQCQSSVQLAADLAGFPVRIHEVPGVAGHIGKARCAGYAQGSHPYVTSVDDDDYILPNAFACLAEALTQKPGAIYTRECELQNSHSHPTDRRHHLAVYRRVLLDTFDFDAWPCYDAMALRNHAEASGEPIIDLDEHVYVHRLYGHSKARILQRAHPEVWERARV